MKKFFFSLFMLMLSVNMMAGIEEDYVIKDLSKAAEDGTVFCLRNNDKFLYGPGKQLVQLAGTAEEALSEKNAVSGWKLDKVVRGGNTYYAIRAIQPNGQNYPYWGSKIVWLNVSDNMHGDVYLGLDDDDIDDGHLWTYENNSLKSVAHGYYLAGNSLSPSPVKWELVVMKVTEDGPVGGITENPAPSAADKGYMWSDNLVKNWDLSTTNLSSFTTKGCEEDQLPAPTMSIVSDGENGNVLKVVTNQKVNADHTWDSQFFISLDPKDAVQEGEKYYISFAYKADKEAGFEFQSHGATPGSWQNNILGTPGSFTKNWQVKSWEGTLSAQDAGANGMINIALNLNVIDEGTNYYFKNIIVKKQVKQTDIWDDVDISTLEMEDGGFTKLPYTVNNDGYYVFNTTENLKLAFKDLNYPVSGYDKIKCEYVAPTTGWVFAFKGTQDMETPAAGSTELIYEFPESVMNTGVLPEITLLTSPWGTVESPFILKSIKLHRVPKAETIIPDVEVPNAVGYKWVSLINNGDFQTRDLTCFPLNGGGAEAGMVEKIIDGPDGNGQKVLAVTSRQKVQDPWDSQVFFKTTEMLSAGTTIWISFAYKADAPATIALQTHAAPQTYTGNFTDVSFTTNWKRFTTTLTLSDGQADADKGGFGSIAFNLNDLADVNTYYFADVRVMKMVEDGGVEYFDVDFASGNDYYIQNVKSGLFLTASNSGDNTYGTRASVTEQGLPWKVTATTTNNFTLMNTLCSVAQKYLATSNDVYVDAAASDWEIRGVKQDNGEIVYYIKNSSGYLQQATNTQNLGYYTAQSSLLSDAGKWRFLTRQQAIAQLEDNATKENPMNATFLIKDPGFNRNMDYSAWAARGYSNDGTNSETAQNYNLSGPSGDSGDAAAYRAAESWRSRNGFDIFQNLTDIPNGIYKLKAQIAYTQYDGTTQPYLYAVGEKTVQNSSNTISLIDDGAGYVDVAKKMGSGSYWIQDITVNVVDNKLRIGVRSSTNGVWVVMDNFTLTYLGNDNEEEVLKNAKASFENAFYAAEREADNNAKRNTDVTKTLKDVVAKYTGANIRTAQEYRSAANELTTATNNATNSTEIYKSINEYNKKAAKLDIYGQEAYAETLNKYNAGTLKTVNEAQTAYIAAVAAQTTPGSNFTDIIVNPYYDGNVNGWIENYSTASHGYQGASHTGIAQFMEAWTSSGSLPDGKMYQRIKLPSGEYTLSAYVLAVQQDGSVKKENFAGVTLYANAITDKVNLKSNTVQTDNNVAVRTSLVFNTTGEGEVEIGVQTVNTNCNWVAVDNWELIYNGVSTSNAYQESLRQTVEENVSNYDEADAQKSVKEAYAKTYADAKQTVETFDLSNEDYINAHNALDKALEDMKASLALYKRIAELNKKVEALVGGEAKQAYASVLATYNNQTADAYAPFEEAYQKAKSLASGGYEIDNIKNVWVGQTGTVAAQYCPDGEGFAERYENGTFKGDVMVQTMTGLKNGTYKVTMKGAASYTSGRNFEGATGKDHAFFFANDGILSLEVKDRSVVNASNGNLETVTLTCVVTDGTLKFGIQNITIGANWFVINLESIVYVSSDMNEKDFSVIVPDNTCAATFMAPIDLTVDQINEEVNKTATEPANLKAYNVISVNGSGDNRYITCEIMNKIPANTPCMLIADHGVNIRFAGTSLAQSATYSKGIMTGTYGALEIKSGYVLQNHDGRIAFYRVESPIVVPEYKCWLTPESVGDSSVKALYFEDGILSDDATAINALNELLNGKREIYDTNGRKLNSMQKGMNIVNGVKVLVK